jgi:dipeptide/tripeptide permease
MAGDAGTVTGPVVAGLLVDGASYPAAFGLAGGVLAAAALLALITPECQNDRDTSRSAG